jgi:hypothetical protein
MITDHRGEARVSVFSGGDLYRKSDGDRIGRALVKDVSGTGLRVETLESLSVGDEVFVDFQVGKGGLFLRVPVKVERVRTHAGSFLAGLSFRTEEDRAAVRRALAKLFDPS